MIIIADIQKAKRVIISLGLCNVYFFNKLLGHTIIRLWSKPMSLRPNNWLESYNCGFVIKRYKLFGDVYFGNQLC